MAPKDNRKFDDQKNIPDAPGTNVIKLYPDKGSDDWFFLGEDLYRTVDNRIVHCNNADGRWLYAKKGTRLPRVELERYGLLEPKGSKDKSSKPESKK